MSASTFKSISDPQKAKPRAGSHTGDGDLCPVAGHGRMHVLLGNQRQYCPMQSHDGEWTAEGKSPATRAFWPYGWKSFAAAVNEYTATNEEPALPDLTIDLGGH